MAATRGPAAGQPGATQTEVLYANRTGANFALSDLAFRDSFIREYIKDFNGKKALLRCGYAGSLSSVYSRASQLLREPYVQNKVDELVRKLRPEDVVQRQQVLARMWHEANDENAPALARVAACAHVAKMLGMFKADEGRGEQGGGQPTGVMFVPIMNVNDWADSAAKAQDLLKRQVTGAYPPPPPPMPAAGGKN